MFRITMQSSCGLNHQAAFDETAVQYASITKTIEVLTVNIIFAYYYGLKLRANALISSTYHCTVKD